MESNLFIELSEEQQEVVAGGADVGASLSSFKGKSTVFGTNSYANAGGAGGSTYAEVTKVSSSTLQFVGLGL
jgi:hypothetical protein